LDPRWRYLTCAIVLGASFGAGLAMFAPASQQAPAGAQPRPQAGLQLVSPPVLGPIMAQGTDIVPIEVPAAGRLPADLMTPQSQLATSAQFEQQPAATQKPDEAAPSIRETAVQATAEPTAPATPKSEPKPTPRPRLSRTEPEKSEATRTGPRATRRSVAEHAPAGPTTKAHAALPAPQKTARREHGPRRLPSEALRTVRKFDDRLQDIPVSAYSADGSRRDIVIRPTSIQDVYYYSVPR
jgi:hypothetical protein